MLSTLLSLKNSLREEGAPGGTTDWSRHAGCQGQKRHFGSDIRSLRLYVSRPRESNIVFSYNSSILFSVSVVYI